MKRRNVLIGMSGVVGGGAILGTGAFSTASARREMEVTVADDTEGLIALRPGKESGAFVDDEGDAIRIDFGSDEVPGEGANVDTEFTFDDLLEVRNQGTQSVFVWTAIEADAFDDDQLYLYQEDSDTALSDANAVEVAVGEAVSLGVFLDTTDLDADSYEAEVTIEAADEAPTGGDDGGSVTDPIPSLLLDSVGSLLDEDQEPLTDASTIAAWAESSAENVDEDGNGDAVAYPDDVDIPFAAVDGNVFGITGPFVTTDTDFANYGNEAFVLNVYDELLGGGGTVIHDEGHGQFYTLAPNGGDDFQAFADYVENNGYTYEATSDIAADLTGADAAVITSPSDAFTDSELAALSEFVADGGVVFLHDQSDFNDFDETDNLNAIASELGVSFRFNDDQILDEQSSAGQPFLPETANFNTVTFPNFFRNRDGLGLELDPSESYEVEVVDVTDGDTADVAFEDGTVEPVRIVGIDAPETGSTQERPEEYEGITDAAALKARGDEATAYAVDQLDGETVTLSFDENEGLRGNFGRLLGFLELPDGTVYNESVVEDGWARVYDSGLGLHDEYWDLEAGARANDRGIWEISDRAATPEIRDDPVEQLFFSEPVAVSGPEVPVRSEGGDPLVAFDESANVAVVGGPIIAESFESAEGGPGIEDYGVFPFLTNVAELLSESTGPVLIDGGHGQFAADFSQSAEDAAYYLRYLEGQTTSTEQFIGFEGVNDVTTAPGPDLLDGGEPAARAFIITTPTDELTAAERSVIAEYADAGGAVLLVGTAADTDALDNFDPLLADLGASVDFTRTPVTDSSNNLAGDPAVPTTSNFDDTLADLFAPFTPN